MNEDLCSKVCGYDDRRNYSMTEKTIHLRYNYIVQKRYGIRVPEKPYYVSEDVEWRLPTLNVYYLKIFISGEQGIACIIHIYY